MMASTRDCGGAGFEAKPQISSTSLVYAHASIDEGNLKRKSEASGSGAGADTVNSKKSNKKALPNKSEANPHVLFTLDVSGEPDFAFTTSVDYRGFDIPFNGKSNLKLVDSKRKKTQGASVMLYRVRFTVELSKDHIFEYDTLPFVILSNASQNAEGWLAIFWDRAFCGDGGNARVELEQHRRIPWPDFFQNLSSFYESQTGRGLQGFGSDPAFKFASYQEDCLLEELKKKRSDSLTFKELTSLDFPGRGKDHTSRWQWIYSFVPLLQLNFGEAKQERQVRMNLY